MTSNQAKIVLTNPCSENWNSMQADTTGRFCQSCQKSVIDFTSQSDDEIRSFLKDKQGEKLCGRFYMHQVERIRIEIDPNILVSDIPFWQKFLVVVLVCFGPDFLGADFIFAQTETDSIPVITEQVDSLDSQPIVEADSTLEVAVDSLKKPVRLQKDNPKWRCYFPDFPIISGSIALVGDHYPLFDGIPVPPLEIPFAEKQSEDDTVSSKTEIAKAVNRNPVVPKQPKRKPAPTENALIADSGDRRKTRKS